jgi:hypothetical protein
MGKMMKNKSFEIRYIELKTGYSDNGPAWIGRVMISKTGKTIYFNDHAFRKASGAGSNYFDVESLDNYWISGVKKTAEDRHWAGNGKMMIDQKIVNEYLEITGKKTLDKNKFKIVEIEDVFPVDRINQIENRSEMF